MTLAIGHEYLIVARTRYQVYEMLVITHPDIGTPEFLQLDFACQLLQFSRRFRVVFTAENPVKEV